MNYHFNEFTFPQLLHLIRGERLNLDTKGYFPGEKLFQIECERKAEPNAGRYLIAIRHVTEAEVLADAECPTDTVEHLVYNPAKKSIRIIGGNFTVSICVTAVRVSAIAQPK